MIDRLPNEHQRTWLWRLKRLPLSTPDFCKLINTKPSTFYAICKGSNTDVNNATDIERTLRELEKGKE